MSVNVILSLILFTIMTIIGKGRGIKSFFALYLNFFILFVAIILIAYNINPLIITLVACMIISSITLFFINGINIKTKIAFVSVIITLLLLILLIYQISISSYIQGFCEEEYESISSYSLYINLNFTNIVMCTILMGLIGAVIDAAISISSSMNEIYVNNKNISRWELFHSGMNIGKDILGTTTNTLYFAYIGGFMALLIWFKDLSYSLPDIINSKVFCAEMIQILASGLGAVLIIPITALITSQVLVRPKN